MMTTTTVEALRSEYRQLQLRSGMSPAAFRAEVERLAIELADGEEVDRGATNLIRVAREVADESCAA